MSKVSDKCRADLENKADQMYGWGVVFVVVGIALLGGAGTVRNWGKEKAPVTP